MEQNERIPDEFYIGQDLVEDKERLKTEIEIFFYSPAILNNFDFFIYGKKIIGTQKDGLLVVRFNQEMPKKLVDELKSGKSEHLVVGYISKYLPRINQEILKQRYTEGHFLVRTFSTLDVYRLYVKIEQDNSRIQLSWPQSITSFPPSKKLAEEKDEIYIRDLVDAGNLYFNGSYDDCVRKVITSAENAFRFYNLKGDRTFLFLKNRKFESIIKRNIYSKNLANEVIANNLIFIYKLRNKIVHHKFRIRFENGWICKKAIGTLFYLYQFLSKDVQTKEYIFSLQMQFLMLDNFCKGTNLENLEKIGKIKEEEIKEEQIIDSKEKMDKFVFEGLRISGKEKSKVLKK